MHGNATTQTTLVLSAFAADDQLAGRQLRKVSMNHEQAKEIVKAWLSDPQNRLFAKFTLDSYPATALISAIAAAPCGECAQVTEERETYRGGWNRAEALLAEARARIAELEAASRPSPDDEAGRTPPLTRVDILLRTWVPMEKQNVLREAINAALTASRNAVIDRAIEVVKARQGDKGNALGGLSDRYVLCDELITALSALRRKDTSK
jgi:hypothetical protein